MPVILKQYLSEPFCGLCKELLSVSNSAVDDIMYCCESKLYIFQLALISNYHPLLFPSTWLKNV